MANPSKAKGTKFESELHEHLDIIFPGIKRSAPGTPSNDFTGPFPIECKKRKVWAVREWIRNARKAADKQTFVIFVSDGDKRLKDAVEDVAIMPTWFALFLLAAYRDLILGVVGEEVYPELKVDEPSA